MCILCLAINEPRSGMFSIFLHKEIVEIVITGAECGVIVYVSILFCRCLCPWRVSCLQTQCLMPCKSSSGMGSYDRSPDMPLTSNNSTTDSKSHQGEDQCHSSLILCCCWELSAQHKCKYYRAVRHHGKIGNEWNAKT